MQLCIFEDSTSSNFNPLVYLRPVFELRCGYTRLFEKIQQRYPDAAKAYLVRDYLKDVTVERMGASVNNVAALTGDVLFVNGRYLDLGEHDFSGKTEEAGVCENGVVYVTGDFELGPGRVIRWVGDQPAVGVKYTLKYTAYFEWLVWAPPQERVDRDNRDLGPLIFLRRRHVANVNDSPFITASDRIPLIGRVEC